MQDSCNQAGVARSLCAPLQDLDMENGVAYVVRTQPKNCGGGTDVEEVFMRIPHCAEELVKEFGCFYDMLGAMNCTWRPTDGTRGPSTLQNTFLLDPRKNLKPPPNLSVSEERHMLWLHCKPPDVFEDCWKYTYRYRSSGSSDWQEKYSLPDTSVHIPYNRHWYEVQVKAVTKDICGIGASDWSKVKSFESLGPDPAPDFQTNAAVQRAHQQQGGGIKSRRKRDGYI